MESPNSLFPALTRDDYRARIVDVLNRGRRRNPDVFLVDWEGQRLVVKDFASRGPIVRRTLAPWSIRHEAEIYRRLEGHPAVPRLIGQIDELAFAVEFRAGRRMSRSLAGTIPAEFFADLVGAVDELHARGVTHLDLRHRSNLMVDEQGKPVLIDFASAVWMPPERWWSKMLMPILTWIDRRALEKWRVRILPQTD